MCQDSNLFEYVGKDRPDLPPVLKKGNVVYWPIPQIPDLPVENKREKRKDRLQALSTDKSWGDGNAERGQNEAGKPQVQCT